LSVNQSEKQLDIARRPEKGHENFRFGNHSRREALIA
jgi:hypothetical protein